VSKQTSWKLTSGPAPVSYGSDPVVKMFAMGHIAAGRCSFAAKAPQEIGTVRGVWASFVTEERKIAGQLKGESVAIPVG